MTNTMHFKVFDKNRVLAVVKWAEVRMPTYYLFCHKVHLPSVLIIAQAGGANNRKEGGEGVEDKEKKAITVEVDVQGLDEAIEKVNQLKTLLLEVQVIADSLFTKAEN